MRERPWFCVRPWSRRELRTKDRTTLFIRIAGQKRRFSLRGQLYQIYIETWQVTHRLLHFVEVYLLTEIELMRARPNCDKRKKGCGKGPRRKKGRELSGFGAAPFRAAMGLTRLHANGRKRRDGGRKRAGSSRNYCGGGPGGGPDGAPEGGPDGPLGGGPPMPPTLKTVAVKAPSLTAPSARTVSPT
jgi:hypothetical protein